MFTVSTITDEAFNGDDTSSETSDGSGLSLREALGLITNGASGPINFDNALSGRTFSLALGVLAVDADTTVDGDLDNDGAADITVSNTIGAGVLSIMTNGVSFTNAGAFLFANSDGAGVERVVTVLIGAEDVNVSNEGEIRAKGEDLSTGDYSVGILVTADSATIQNSSGATIISEGRFAIETEYAFDGTSPVDITIINDGLIESSDDAIRIAQGEIYNSGTIRTNATFQGSGPEPGRSSDGILGGIGEFDNFAVPTEGLTTVNNVMTGLIEGHRSAIYLVGGGVVNNDGEINGDIIAIAAQGLFDGSETAVSINNTGLIERRGDFWESQVFVEFVGAIEIRGGLASVTINNSGEIRSTDYVVNTYSGTILNNTADGVILGNSDNANDDAIAFRGSEQDDFRVFATAGFMNVAPNQAISTTQNVSVNSHGNLVTEFGIFPFKSDQAPVVFVSDAPPILPLVDFEETQDLGFVVYERNSVTNTILFAEVIDVVTSSGVFTVTYDGEGHAVTDIQGDPVFSVPADVNFDDIIANEGLIVGDVITGVGDDIVTNSGIVQGDFFLGIGDDTLTDNDYGHNIDGDDGADIIFANGGADNVSGGKGQDDISGGGGNDFIRGQNGSDNLSGDYGDDHLEGGGGADTIAGDAGADSILGGSGADSLEGGEGNDMLDAGKGLDEVSGGSGADFLRGCNGSDFLSGDDGQDTLTGGGGNDTLKGGVGEDVLRGNIFDDELHGSAGNDTLFGGKGNDMLDGGTDNDILFGRQGDDTLTGGGGDDTLEGEGGKDTFLFEIGKGNDQINDLESGPGTADVIQLIGFGTNFDEFSEVIAAAMEVGGDVVIDFGGGDSLTLVGRTIAQLDANDFSFG